MVVFNFNVSYVVIDGVLFKDEVEVCKVMVVLVIFFNGELFD